MRKYIISFAKWYTYEVEANYADEAIEQAKEEFDHDRRKPIADTVWDEMTVEDEKGIVLHL